MSEPSAREPSIPPTVGTVLVLDDETEILASLYRQLQREFHVFTATTTAQALTLLDRQPVDVVIADQRLPDANGADFLREVYRNRPDTTRILLTGYSDLATAIQAINEGHVYAYLAKPWDPLELRALLRNAIQEARMRTENLRLLDHLRHVEEQLKARIDEQARVLHDSEENFRSVVHKNNSGILLVDATGTILFANPAAEILLGRDSQDLLGSEFGIPATGERAEMTILRPCGQRGTAELTVTETQWRHQDAYLLMLHDITERKEAESQARYLAQHDSLTGLPNRMLFIDRLDQALRRTRRDRDKTAILFLDLDRFKEVNDTLGHKVGDQLLQQVASRLADAVRRSDTVARMGGDEFTVLLEGLNDREHAGALARKLRSLFDQPISTDTGELFAIPSIGISVYPDDAATDAESLIRQADSAMYHAKRHKEMDVCFYSKALDSRNLDRLGLENSLHRALDRNEFVLHYQIQVDLRERRTTGMEALVRWRHPDRGLVPPNDFIPLLEETGLILPVGDWILAEACRQMREWRYIGLDPVPVAVNISPKQLADKSFVQTIQGLLAHSGLSPDLLRLELTESAVMQDQFRALQTLRAVRELGIELHMDDFGVGYSSLGLLKQLPFDLIKIDRSFIVDLLDDSESALLTRAIVNVAHGLKKKVVAEGVETEAQAAHLLYIGCNYAQGWLFGKAVSAAEMTVHLRGLPGSSVRMGITPSP